MNPDKPRIRPLHAILIVGGIVVGIPVVSLGLYLLMDAERIRHVAAGGAMSDEAVESALRRGQAIIAALEARRAVQGTYPRTLEELAPRFIERLEAPAKNESWRYQALNEGEAFELGFGAGTWGRVYSSVTKEWIEVER